MESKEEQYRKDVVEGAKAIYKKGLVEPGEGNVSVRNGKKEEFFITPSFNQYETLTINDVVHMKFDGTALSAGKLPSTEAIMHTMIYRTRPKVHCVIHTHSPYATMLSIDRMSIPIIMEEQVIFLGGSVEVSDFGKAHTNEIGQAAINALGIKNAALLSNHGVIVCGKSTGHAVKFAELVEKLAKMYWGALQVGKPYVVPEEHYQRFYRHFDSLFANYPRKMHRTSK